MAEYLTTDTDLMTVANAIRAKTGSDSTLTYPSGFASAIAGIASTCTATADDIRTGKTAYVGNEVITGAMSGQEATTYHPSKSDQTIAADQYLAGAQTIKAVTTNLVAWDIRKGFTAKIGDSTDDDCWGTIEGSFTSDANAESGHILSGKSAYVDGVKVNGSIQTKAGETFHPSASDRQINAGLYMSAAQVIKGVRTENIDADKIRAGYTIKVGDASDASCIISKAGTFTSDATASASDILKNKTAYKNGAKLTGTIESKGAATYTVSTSQREIAAGQYLSGKQTILAVTTSNIAAANIKKGVTVTVGDTSGTQIANVTGTCVPCTTNLSTYCPYMWQNNQSVVPKHYYDSDTSGDHAAERTPGYRINVYESKNFIVPCNIKVTYFAYSTSESTSSVTLTAGTVYNFQMADNNSKAFKIMEGSTEKISRGWKVTKWEVV